MIRLQNVSKTYKPDISVLKKINLHIKPGEFVSVVGQSGTGKTTLVKTLIGEERIDTGKVIVGGWDITNIRQSEIPILRRQIGVVFQDFKLLPKKTLFENIAFALQVCGQSQKKIDAIVPQVMRIVGLEGKMHRYPQEVSGGEQQRAVIARSLVHRPKILLADEPTGNLDPKTGETVFNLIREMNQVFGLTTVMVTHNYELARQMDRCLTLLNGKLVESGIIT